MHPTRPQSSLIRTTFDTSTTGPCELTTQITRPVFEIRATGVVVWIARNLSEIAEQRP